MHIDERRDDDERKKERRANRMKSIVHFCLWLGTTGQMLFSCPKKSPKTSTLDTRDNSNIHYRKFSTRLDIIIGLARRGPSPCPNVSDSITMNKMQNLKILFLCLLPSCRKQKAALRSGRRALSYAPNIGLTQMNGIRL